MNSDQFAKEGEKEQKPLETQIFQSMAADRKKGVFAPSADMGSLGEPMDDSDKKVHDDERLRYAQATTKMRDWFKSNPDATEDQAEDYRQSLTIPHLIGHVINSVKPQPNVSEDDYKKLKSGDAYWWDGKQVTKKSMADLMDTSPRLSSGATGRHGLRLKLPAPRRPRLRHPSPARPLLR